MRSFPFYKLISWLAATVFLLGLAAPAVSGQTTCDGGTCKVYLPVVLRGFGAPVLKWSYGGCYSSWCETGWYSSPALADVNGDGANDVIASAYSLVALNGKTGGLIWRMGGTSNRTWPGIVVADIDKDGQKEIVIAQSGGYVTVYTLAGAVKWQRRPTTYELRGLLVADLDGNGSTLEVVVTGALGSQTNTWVYDSSGTLRPGWPELTGSGKGYAWGVYNANAAAGNLDATDAKLELVVPSDVHYINAYKPDGTPLPANTTVYPGRAYWGLVGVYEDPTIEIKGYGDCYTQNPPNAHAEHSRTNFADGPAVIADVNGDGTREVVVTGNTNDCYYGYPPSMYTGVYIFNKDRTRFNTGGYDWRTVPTYTGAPLSENYNVIQSAEANPVVADLDGDGKMEILFASYDGRMHAYWLDKTQHGAWPFSVYDGSEIRFASEPVVADLDDDGKAEVIFTSWVPNGSGHTGKLFILSYLGQLIYSVDLPPARGDNWSGGLPAPTLGNIDDDPDLEVVVNTSQGGVVAYDLPGTANAHVLWGTGRGSFTRDGYR
jgi:hypothetical protein